MSQYPGEGIQARLRASVHILDFQNRKKHNMVCVYIHMVLNKMSWQTHFNTLTLSANTEGSLKRNK